MSQQLPPGTPENFAWFASWISEQFGKLEGKLDSMKSEFITRRELERLQVDVDRAHERIRNLEQGILDEMEDRIRTLELTKAENKASLSASEKIIVAVFAVVQLAFMVWATFR